MRDAVTVVEEKLRRIADLEREVTELKAKLEQREIAFGKAMIEAASEYKHAEKAEAERDAAQDRHAVYLKRMEEVLGPIRQRRPTGEPSRSDFQEVKELINERTVAQAKCAELSKGYRHLGEVAMSCKPVNTPEWMKYLLETIAEADRLLDSDNPGQRILDQLRAAEASEKRLRESLLLMQRLGDSSGVTTDGTSNNPAVLWKIRCLINKALTEGK